MSQNTRLFYPLKNAQPGYELVPLKATANGVLGKTVANGLADHLKAALVGTKENGPPYFLVACAGQSRRQIQELSTDERTPESRRDGGGDGYDKTILDDARRAMEQGRATGASLEVRALYWMQGERPLWNGCVLFSDFDLDVR